MTVGAGGNLVAVVTQWAGTAGFAICEVLASQGFQVIVNGPVDELALSGIAGSLMAMPFELAQEISVVEASRGIIEQFGRVDVLINNATLWDDAALPEISDRMWTEMHDTNLKSFFYSSKAFAPTMVASNFGKIINITSTSAFTGAHTAYAAACAGVTSLTRSLAQELAPAVRVNAIACGLMDEAWIDAEFRQELISKVPLRRLCRPEDVADLVAYLALSGDFMTGQTIVLDGGESRA